MSSLHAAQEHADTIRQAVEALTFAPVVTVEAGEAIGALTGGHAVALVRPPRVEYPDYHECVYTIETYLIATGPQITAWDTLDQLADAIRVPCDIDTLAPAEFTGAQGKTYPAFIATASIHYRQ